jgi:hypothetical protein
MTPKNIGGTAALAAIALAITFGATIARADYNGGDPIQKGNMCWAATDGSGHGFWKVCPKPAKKMGHMKSQKKVAKK